MVPESFPLKYEKRYKNRSAGNRVATQPKPAASISPSAKNASVDFNIPQNTENINGNVRAGIPAEGNSSPADGILRSAQNDSVGGQNDRAWEYQDPEQTPEGQKKCKALKPSVRDDAQSDAFRRG